MSWNQSCDKCKNRLPESSITKRGDYFHKLNQTWWPKVQLSQKNIYNEIKTINQYNSKFFFCNAHLYIKIDYIDSYTRRYINTLILTKYISRRYSHRY